MKAQKLGLVLGMNMAVACLVFQGCKVTQPGAGNMPSVREDPAVAAGEASPVSVVESTGVDGATVAESSATAPAASSIEVASAPESVVEPQQPSQVAVVKPLPAARPRPVATVSAPASASVVEPAAGATSSVVVQHGDTLSAICMRNRVKMSAVVAANPGLNPNFIRAGQKIVIPGGSVAAATASAAKPSRLMHAAAPVAANTSAPVKTKASFKAYEGPTKEYKVRSGDMLGKIAYSSGITVRALKEMNKLSGDSIRVGQVLLIPAEKVQATATVATKAAASQGGSAKKASKAVVAKKAGASEPAPSAKTVQPSAAVAESVQTPAVGQAAPVAVAEAAAPASAPAAETVAQPQTQADAVVAASDAAVTAPTDAAPASSMTYTVKEGDDIVGVAIAWGISPSQLMDLNNLKAGEAITPGQVLKLPANAKQSSDQ